ncbi:UDP-glycosyltransferase 89B2-like [Diospyros lotus]|uniref:UDP-glycosyltransferase 89B2-like n=1 Tax=Diospyros lotus TaxID=55363 RepID=UPI00224EDFDD|nr:UDP-glycosyltransferase 89B2-like [Diospyros lotus]
MTVAGAGGGAHILVFPYPAQGHLIPLLDLTSQLVRHGLAITLLVTPKNLAFLNPLRSRHPAIKTLVLPFPGYASLPAGVENVQHLPAGSFRMMFHALGGLYDPLLRWFHAQPSPPVAIISDIFLGWTQHLASKLGIRRVVFSPSGGMAVAVMNSLWRDLPKGEDPNDDNALVYFPEIPNSPVYPWLQVSPLYRSYVEGDPVSEFLKDGFRANVASWGLVVNSFSGLERAYLAHLKKELGHDRVWAVGPLLPSNDDQSGPTERGGSSSVWPIDILSWLDRSQDDSVVYVCFGSQAVLTNGQMEALALGLEKSGARFLWCVKEPTAGHVSGMYGAIPSSFEDRAAGRGMVVRGWAPQVLILRHRSIGAFLTHCGWNSVLEAIYAGVPMLAWPMTADQFVNATLLVDELKVARTVCEGAGAVPNSDELARCLAEAVGEKREERVRSAKLREAALEAMKDGGSSSKDLVDLVTLLSDGAVNWSSRSVATPTG